MYRNIPAHFDETQTGVYKENDDLKSLQKSLNFVRVHVVTVRSACGEKSTFSSWTYGRCVSIFYRLPYCVTIIHYVIFGPTRYSPGEYNDTDADNSKRQVIAIRTKNKTADHLRNVFYYISIIMTLWV